MSSWQCKPSSAARRPDDDDGEILVRVVRLSHRADVYG
jgi:hypothetical protein